METIAPIGTYEDCFREHESDWAEAFGEGSCLEPVRPFNPITREVLPFPYKRKDVAKVLFAVVEFGDYAETTCEGIFKMKDGRYLYVKAGCDTTGWDCQADTSHEWCDSFSQVKVIALWPDEHFASVFPTGEPAFPIGEPA